MTATISRRRIDVLISVNREYNRKNDLPIDIEEKWELGSNKVEFGINWAAIGTVDADKAYEFADYMRYVAGLTKVLNGLDLVYDWNAEDPKIKDMESYKEAYSVVKTWFWERYVSKIASFVEGGII